MRSTTIQHFEDYNKEFDLEVFFEELGEKTLEDRDEFYRTVMRAIFKSNPKLKKINDIDYDKEYERKVKDDEDAKDELFQTYEVLGMMREWLNFKQIYKFDLDTLDTLFESKCSDLTYEELKCLKMPYECFAIENDIAYKDIVIDSTLVCRRMGTELEMSILSIYGYAKRDKSQRLVRLDLIVEKGKSLYEYLEEHADEECIEYVKKVLNLIEYLCQPKVDVRIIRSTPKKKQIKKLKHFYNIDYEENEVGYRLGSAIRNYKYIYKKDESPLTPSDKPRRKVKPHTRCGHYHHYWIGKGRTDLIVKYVEPTFVLGGSKIATIHNVKRDTLLNPKNKK